ncbi:MAG: hypothetical protein V4480_02770 [Patescibacteria group bacterium]
MNDTNSGHSIQEAVLAKVRAGEVRRHSRAYFLARLAGTIAVSILLLVVCVLIISFILFSLHESDEQILLGFGLHGVEVFLGLFPWLLGLIAASLILVLEWMLRRFRFGYRIPLLNVFIGIFVVSVALSALINFTPLHATLLHVSDQGELPVLGGVYQHVLDHHDDRGFARGRVVAIQPDSFLIQHDDHDRDRDDGTFVVRVQDHASLPELHVGDEVVVLGNPGPGYITATRIEVVGARSASVK